jgi:response regulator RpfG family c-di-GMP phosphodiesterase
VLISDRNTPYIQFLHLLAASSQSITTRGLLLYASAPQEYHHLTKLPFPAYLPALSEDLKTPEFSTLLSSASLLFRQAAQNLAGPELEALRQLFFDCFWRAASAQTWFPQEGGHAHRVARNAAGLAGRLGYSDAEVYEVHWGGLLHDIGKVFVGELFVALTDQGLPIETALPFIRAHASLGRDFLESVLPLFPTALVCAAQHQESVDGSGYPAGLKYEQLTLPGQIVNLADGYDATITRLGWSASQVCADIQSMYTRAGYPHAPIVSAFLQLIEERHTEWYPSEL